MASAALDVEALKKELMEELRKEFEAKAAGQQAALSKEEQEANAYLSELVTIRLFKDGKDYKDDLGVHINGKNFVIKRGVNVEVPRKYALVIEAHERQETAANDYAAGKQEEFRSEARRFNI